MDKKFIIVTKQHDGSGFIQWKKSLSDNDTVIVAYNKKEANLETDEEKKDYMLVGKGIFEKFPLDTIMAKREKMRDWYWIFDTNNSWKEADQLKIEGFKVFGSGKFNYQLENDRQFAIKVAEKCGLQIPLYQEFKNIAEGVKFLQEHPDQAFVFKPNGGDSHLTTVINTPEPVNSNIELQQFIQSMGINDFILQEKKKGIEVNVEAFMMNGEPMCADIVLENKRKNNNDRGCMIGCSGDIDFQIPLSAPIISMTIGKYFSLLKNIKYTGFADVNCIIADDQIWFLENCMRWGWNATPNFFSTLSRKDIFQTISEMLDGKFIPSVREGFGASITMTTDFPHDGIPIYFPDTIQNNVYLFGAQKVKEQYLQSGYFKEITIVTGFGYTIKDAAEEALENVEKVKFVNADWRDDLAKDCYYNAPIKRYEALRTLKLI